MDKASISLNALSMRTQGEEKFRWKRLSTSPQKGKEKTTDCFKQEKQEQAKIRQGKTQEMRRFRGTAPRLGIAIDAYTDPHSAVTFQVWNQ